ncbi:MAG: hypothetical protein EKK51_14205 [Mycolicibacterium sp.]|uniref:hypothetical protein n=1 Tax=Mycolicibacterium sp. TaxID=2320850 RepID=UPI000926E290|nr:hypothetical protein [Mycolicibacterium sp.]RUP31520.1 MAG: hypothetical protein EKK51_14205 [Mycolicibacterium sp.]SHU10834.1 Uncharacterised protein [Mycobacteroides abscessus subsp. abscessus]
MPPTDAIRKVLESDELLDMLAAIEHERWAHWQRYVHDRCERQQDGSLVIPAGLAARWEAQIETPYVELTERERDSDREQVRRYLPVIIDVLTR